jgi:aminopeptidase YwaD
VRTVAAALAFVGTIIAAQAQGPAAMPAGAERAYQAVKGRVNGDAAMDIVRFMDQYWRIAGNPGFNASVDRIRDGLQKAGLQTRVE